MELEIKKLNILAVLPHSIAGRLIISSISDGFEQLGHKVIKYDEIYGENEWEKIIEDNSFDYIVGYDYSALKLKVDNKLQFPVINYFSDEIDKPTAGEERKDYYKNLYDEDSFTFYWDEYLTNELKSEIKNLYYMPHFVNTNLYKNKNTEIEHDIMFCGRLDTDFRLNFWLSVMKRLPHCKFAWYAIEKHYKDALGRVSNEDKKLITESYKGFIDNELAMCDAINKSKIVINTHAQGVSSYNYRTIQTMACQRLMLSDYKPEADTLFQNNEIVIYNDFDDMISKIEHYLSNDEAYIDVVSKARACAVKNHDAKSCVEKMLSIINNLS